MAFDPLADLDRPRLGLLDPERVAADRVVVERIRARESHPYRQLARQLNAQRKVKARASRRRSSKSPWQRRREKALARDGYKCVACGATEDLTIDHVIPKSKGGSNAMGNLQTMCAPCNRAKGDQMPGEVRLSGWRARAA